MDLETIFSLVSTIALLSWIALFIFYKKSWIYPILFSGILVFLALVYLYFISVGLTAPTQGGFGSLREVRLLFENDNALLAGWIHYLAFDLFVGMWMARDSYRQQNNRWVLLLCLLFTFMLGPVGLLIYLIVRIVRSGKYLQYPFSKEGENQSL